MTITDTRKLVSRQQSAQAAMGIGPSKTGANTQWILWGLLLGLLVRLTVFLRQREGSEYLAIDAVASVEIGLIILTIVILLTTARLKLVLKLIAKNSMALLLGYYAFGALSSVWSASFEFSLFRSVEVISQLLAIVVAMSFCRGFAVAEKRMLAMCMVCIGLGMYIPIGFVGFNFSLYNWHSNAYPASAAIICCYCAGEIFAAGRVGQKKHLWIFGIIALLCMAVGTSSASIFSTLGGIAVAALLCKNRAVLFMCGLIAISAYLFAPSDFIRNVFFYGKEAQSIENFSGRTDIWQAYSVTIMRAPFLGHGFSQLSRLALDTSYTTNAHNFFIGALGGTGLAGFSIIVIWLFKLLAEVIKSVRSKAPGSVGCAAALAAGLANSMACAYLGENYGTTTFVFGCVIALHMLFVRPRPVARNGT